MLDSIRMFVFKVVLAAAVGFALSLFIADLNFDQAIREPQIFLVAIVPALYLIYLVVKSILKMLAIPAAISVTVLIVIIAYMYLSSH